MLLKNGQLVPVMVIVLILSYGIGYSFLCGNCSYTFIQVVKRSIGYKMNTALPNKNLIAAF